ncbi:MAG: Nif3-like dinuclear metal center hexameric protein [Clostridia bacterium]|nr:Nif3-like dinuclear metal center hexameric protein [Clostridia bacterium]
MKISELMDFLNSWAPFESAMDFDNCGLLVGDKNGEADLVLLALDLTEDVLAEAKNRGAGAILTHHPLIFRAQKSFTSEGLPYRAARLGISVIGCHTNLDIAPGGVNDTLIGVLGLEKLGEVTGTGGCCAMCACPEELSEPKDLALRVKDAVGLPCVRLVDGKKPVKKVAVCCGGGASFIDAAVSDGADAMITGDIKYAAAVDAVRSGFTLIDAGHYETERIILPVLAEKLSVEFENCRFAVAESCRSAFEFIL